MPGTDLDLLIHAARAAAVTATGFIGGALDITRKDDDSPVTAADHAVNDVLAGLLRTARPDYGWLSEESPDTTDRLARDHTFIIDPIDGTRSFIDGQDTWAHSLAVAHHGKITAAVVLLPLKDRLYTAALGGGAHLNGAPIAVSHPVALDSAQILTTRPNLDAMHWPRGVPGFTRAHRPSLAYRLSLIAQGRYDAMFTFRPSWEWDIAAGALIAAEAGARVSDGHGAPLQFNNAMPQTAGVIVAGPPLWAEIMAHRS